MPCGLPSTAAVGGVVEGGAIWSIAFDQASSFDRFRSIFQSYPQVVDNFGVLPPYSAPLRTGGRRHFRTYDQRRATLQGRPSARALSRSAPRVPPVPRPPTCKTAVPTPSYPPIFAVATASERPAGTERLRARPPDAPQSAEKRGRRGPPRQGASDDLLGRPHWFLSRRRTRGAGKATGSGSPPAPRRSLQDAARPDPRAKRLLWQAAGPRRAKRRQRGAATELTSGAARPPEAPLDRPPPLNRARPDCR